MLNQTLKVGQDVVIHVDCHCCGFEPAVNEAVPVRCPKCGGRSWDRYVALEELHTAIPMNFIETPKVCAFLPSRSYLSAEVTPCSRKS